MGVRRAVGSAAAAALMIVALTGCAEDDEIYVSTITDGHGRACTFVYTAREGEDLWDSRDVDVSQLDCEYPPEGAEPGEPGTVQMEAGE